MFQLKSVLRKLGGLSLHESFKLFDTYVTPVLLYGSEIWGYDYSPQIEQVHYQFCKFLLNVSGKTNDLAAVGECGRFPLYVMYFKRSVNYWLKILQMGSHRFPYKCYIMLNRLSEERAIKSINWVYNIKNLLYRFGFGHVWLNQGVGSTSLFLSEFSQRLKDCAGQNWHHDLELSARLRTYCTFKSMLEPEKYLTVVNIPKFRIALSKFRCSSHVLEIEKGRHESIPVDERYCKLCLKNNNFCVEDEYHFLCICPTYRDLRREMLPYWFRINPSLDNFKSLLSTSNVMHLNNLASFIYFAMKKREDSLSLS